MPPREGLRRRVDTGVRCDGSGQPGDRCICPVTHAGCRTCGRVLLCDDIDRVPEHTITVIEPPVHVDTETPERSDG